MWTQIIIVLFLPLWEMCAGASIPAEEACPMSFQPQEILKVFDTKCYKFVMWSNVDYEGAQMFCEGQGGFLASIKDQQAQNFMVDEVKKLNYNGRIWIGLSDTAIKGRLAWADGTEMTYSNFDKGQGLSLSDTTTPYRHCVAMDTVNGLWYDEKCGIFNMLPLFLHLPYVCQFSNGKVGDDRPTPPPQTN